MKPRFVIPGVIVASVIGYGLSHKLARNSEDPLPPRVLSLSRLVPTASKKSGHSVYRLSVVDGGVHGSEDLVAAQSDPVVKAHYQNAMAYSELFATPVAAKYYISYRRHDRVYWTRHKKALTPLEQVMMTSAGLIRARCGNRLSEVPMQPTEDNDTSIAAEREMNEFVPAREKAEVPVKTPIPDLETAQSMAYVPTTGTPVPFGSLAVGGGPPSGFSPSGFPVVVGPIAGTYPGFGSPIIGPLPHIRTDALAIAPEPSMFGCVGGAMAALLLVVRRYRKTA